MFPFRRLEYPGNKVDKEGGNPGAERDLSLNLLGQAYQQNVCPVCTVEVAEGSWKRLGPLLKIFHSRSVRRALGHKCLMVVMYNGRETGINCITMQRLRCINVVYMDTIAHIIIPYIACVHKQVEIQMEDGSPSKHKFTNLSREFMFLSSTNEKEKRTPLFDVVMPLVARMHTGSAVLTYHNDNKEAAILIRKIRHSVALCFFGYWMHVMRYKNGMIKKLMESFESDAAKLANLFFLPLTWIPLP